MKLYYCEAAAAFQTTDSIQSDLYRLCIKLYKYLERDDEDDDGIGTVAGRNAA